MLEISQLLESCTFPSAGTPAICGLSGGADSSALVALALEADCVVEAVHAHHGLRDSADDDADTAATIARRLGVPLRVVRLDLVDGPNLEARARAARHAALGPDAMTGHTADDQAETLLLALMRGSGSTGLSAIGPGWRHPILSLRSSETRQVCDQLGLVVAHDPSNDDPRFRRNRVRHELLPLLDSIADRDTAPLLTRTADLLRADDQLLEELAGAIDPTDAAALAAAPSPLAARAVRSWLTSDGYPPDAAAILRVLTVARGDAAACEISGALRVERHGNQLVLCSTGPCSS
ncbi:MAG: tRNA lysidine(34) synthetase TilS [Ilumatobacteraceae bacterium]